MANTSSSVKAADNENVDLYKNQLKYNKYLENKKKVYSILCFIAAIVNIVTMFTLPMFKYHVKGNSKKGIKGINGEYTHTYIIEKYFNNGIGQKNLLNTAYIIILFAMIILAVILVVGTALNIFAKKLVQSEGIVKKIFNYAMIEIFSTTFIVLLVAAMICGRVDVSGGADNAIGFWVYAVASAVMICTSIPLSDK